jgi:hypothetical protein
VSGKERFGLRLGVAEKHKFRQATLDFIVLLLTEEM